MKTLKIVSFTACVFILALITAALIIEDPLKIQYQNTLETLLETEHLPTEATVLRAFSSLKTVSKKLDRADCLKIQIQSLTGGPAPRLNEAEAVILKEMQLEMVQLRAEAKHILTQFMAKNKMVAAFKNQI